MEQPLADRIRPQTLDEVVGQRHLLAPGALLRRFIDGGSNANMIFYGPSGVGKTTVANIIAQRTKRPLYRLNATNASTQDIRDIMADIGTIVAPNGVLLYLDEIQYFNKRQQQSLLEFMENGKITLIASTTENPYFCVFNALLSRSTVFEFKALTAADVSPAVERGLAILAGESHLPLRWEEGVVDYIASACGGDVRKALNALEFLYEAAEVRDGTLTITLSDAYSATQRSAMRYDREGDNHYDLLSALQKSIRGSDPNGQALGGGGSAVPLPAAAGHRGGGYRSGLPHGHPHCEGLRGLGPSDRPAGGPPALGRRGHPLGHGPQVQHRVQCHHRRHAGRGERPHRGCAPAPSERPRRLRRQRSTRGIQVSPCVSPALGSPAVSPRRGKGRGLLRVRRQQNRTGG